MTTAEIVRAMRPLLKIARASLEHYSAGQCTRTRITAPTLYVQPHHQREQRCCARKIVRMHICELSRDILLLTSTSATCELVWYPFSMYISIQTLHTLTHTCTHTYLWRASYILFATALWSASSCEDHFSVFVYLMAPCTLLRSPTSRSWPT